MNLTAFPDPAQPLTLPGRGRVLEPTQLVVPSLPDGIQIGAWRDRQTGLAIVATIEPAPPYGMLRHVSVSYPSKDPSWHELKLLKKVFFGDDAYVMQIFPAEQSYVNLQEHCFHLWEMPEAWAGV